jgi:hypothetical protein
MHRSLDLIFQNADTRYYPDFLIYAKISGGEIKKNTLDGVTVDTSSVVGRSWI